MAIISEQLLSLPYAIAVAALLVLFYVRSITAWRARTLGRPLPPGPRRLPVIGSMLSVPTWKPWLGFRDLSAKFGEIVYFEVLGRPMVVLSSPGIIDEFLEKRSANTSDRVKTALIPLAGHSFNLAFMPYGQQWRAHRRMFWQYFQAAKAQHYWPVQRAVVRKTLTKLLDSPSALKRIIQYHVTAATMKITYGIDIEDADDERVDMVDQSFVGMRKVTAPVQFLLQHLPAVRNIPSWLPGAGFRRALDQSSEPIQYMLNVPFSEAKRNAINKAGTESDSIVAGILKKLIDSPGEDIAQQEQVARNVAAITVTGGSDTTFSTIAGFFVALSLSPEVQKKAQAELDAIVGPDRLPDFDDRDALVYINATVKEALRWHNVAPLGVAHSTMEDDELHGYFIPGGTTVVPNMWAIMHDPRFYPEPDKFIPDRFIRDGQLNPAVLDPAKVVFGYGRRFCPGRHFADSALYLIIACVLHVYDIGPPLDESGRPLKLEYQASHGFLSYPEDCRCTIKPRSAQAEALIRNSVADRIQAPI
ncbi:cytochrome P450 [Trametes punicea]|nr:cytochrome P450 [Trametes punicea]